MPDLFHIAKAATVNIAATTSTGRVKITHQDGRCQVRVVNPGTTIAFVEFGDSTVVASATASAPVLGGTTAGFTIPKPYNDDIYMAVIMASGTATVYATPGVGL